MKRHQFIKKTGLFAVVALMATLVQVQAVDEAAAAGTLGDVAKMVTQANGNLAKAASSRDLEAIKEAVLRADAVNTAQAEAKEAYAAMEKAIADGDEEAAAAAVEDLNAAWQKAYDALNGPVPEPRSQSAYEEWKEGMENTGGGPGRAYDPENIYDVLWETQGSRHFYQSLFGNLWSASSQGGSDPFGDRDATPE